ncbi:MAG: hypothetical protein APF76_09555 [Desulfitibacter sp. BRH_c19]|nr:MAG: hypothetical protein APF76_09555 [Desulfitibacter sp. BRH_c19]
MSNGTTRNFFPGGNTCLGFYSLYDNIIQQNDASRIFVIKGGPGVGKSTFMKSIGNTMVENGYDIEQHWCSSDNGSLDGIVIPTLGVCLLDGTAPHVVDPKTPGAVDEIIHLGDHWNENMLIENKADILETSQRVSRSFKTAYASLKEAKVIHEEWISYITECVDFTKANQITQKIIGNIFDNLEPQYQSFPRSRELFASATTPMGLVNEWPSILQNCQNIFILRGKPGTGKSTVVERVLNRAKSYGLYTEVFRSSFDPLKFSGVYIPTLQVAVINPFPNDYTLDGFETRIAEVDLNIGLMANKVSVYEREISECRERFWNSINRTINYVAKAKRVHDELEAFYVPAMDFSKINQVKVKTLQRILTLRK